MKRGYLCTTGTSNCFAALYLSVLALQATKCVTELLKVRMTVVPMDCRAASICSLSAGSKPVKHSLRAFILPCKKAEDSLKNAFPLQQICFLPPTGVIWVATTSSWKKA